MSELKHLVTVREASFVRALAEGMTRVVAEQAEPHEFSRIWQPHRGGPIRVVAATSARARCRECGARLEQGERVVVFGFQSEPWNPGGHVQDAYLHEEPCGAEGGE